MEEYKEKFIEYLESNDLKYIDRKDKVSCCCVNPEHQDSSPSAFAKFDDNIFYHCSVCGYHLSTENFISFLGGKVDNTVLFRNKMNKLFKEFKEKRDLKVVTPESNYEQDSWKNSIFLPPKHKDFAQKYRGISPETFEKVNCFITHLEHYYKKRLIFPLYDYKNNLKGFDAVSTSKDVFPKVLRSKSCETTSFFGFENILGKDYFKRKDIVFISEGLFSALSFIELNYQGIFNFGVASIEDKLEVLYSKGIKEIYLVGDKDEAGFKFNSEMYHLLKKSFKVKLFKHPFLAEDKSDSNDYLKKNELQKLIDKTLSII